MIKNLNFLKSIHFYFIFDDIRISIQDLRTLMLRCIAAICHMQDTVVDQTFNLKNAFLSIQMHFRALNCQLFFNNEVKETEKNY